MNVQIGTKLGPYEILAPIGAGGMGEVWKARDPRVGRDVAIKISQAQFSDHFSREARAVAALNHPNICTLYDVGPNYLVMEYVDGPTLAERIAQSPIPLAEALEITRQIGAALEEAHQKMVVHRDFKPGNVKIKPNGTVKVLDFGLAKLPAPQPRASGEVSDSPTLTMAATQAGMILGTAAYMSPEQARGEPVDKRADVWAFGVVLWEMLTGKRLFQGKTTSDVLAALLTDEPDLKQVPAKVRPLLNRCLEKDPQRRLRDIGDAMGIVGSTVEARPPSSRLTMALAGVAGVSLLALVVLAFLYFRATPRPARMVTTNILSLGGAEFDFGTTPNPPVLSPDGLRIAFSARSQGGKTQLWIRALSSPRAYPLPGTESSRYPFWSPDSKSIGFFAGGKLKTIDAAGGPALTLADAPSGHGGSWSPEGVIVFSPNETGALQRVSASGGTVSAATTLDGGEGLSHRGPWFLPDHRHFIFEYIPRGSGDTTIKAASLDSKETKAVARATSNAIYADGHLLFLRDNTLMAQPFDSKRIATSGDAVPVAEQIGRLTADAMGLFSAAAGLLTYQAGTAAGYRRLTWFDRGGKQTGTLGDGDLRSLEFSPDRKSLLASVDTSGSRDLWIYDVARELRTRFTFSNAVTDDAIWSPDGRSIVFSSNRPGPFDDLYRKSSDGAGNEELLYRDNLHKFPASWSPDGKFLLYTAVSPETDEDIWVLPLMPTEAGTAAKPFPFLQTPFRELRPQFSPDGRWIAYMSNESQQFEIYVAPFPGPGGKRQISTSGGYLPRWRHDGKEIFYIGLDSLLTAAEVNISGNTIEVGQVRSLGGLGVAAGQVLKLYDVSADGQRFMVGTAPQQNGASIPLTLIQNWTAGLKK